MAQIRENGTGLADGFADAVAKRLRTFGGDCDAANVRRVLELAAGDAGIRILLEGPSEPSMMRRLAAAFVGRPPPPPPPRRQFTVTLEDPSLSTRRCIGTGPLVCHFNVPPDGPPANLLSAMESMGVVEGLRSGALVMFRSFRGSEYRKVEDPPFGGYGTYPKCGCEFLIRAAAKGNPA